MNGMIYISKIRSIKNIEVVNQRLFDSTLARRVAPKIPQAALNADDNKSKILCDKTKHCFMSGLALLQQQAKAHPKKIATNGTMNITQILTLAHVTTSWFQASESGHKLEVKAQIDHGITRAREINPRTILRSAKHLLFSIT